MLNGQPPARRAAVGLFLLFCLIYLGTAKGVLEQVDDVAMLRVTESLVHNGSFAVAADTPGSAQGVDGRYYTRYGVGQSLVAIPFYIVGSLLPRDVPTRAPFNPSGYVTVSPLAFAMTGLGILSTAGTIALLYLTGRALDFSHAGSLAAAVALGLGTFAWHYSRTFLSEPPSMFCSLLAFYALVRFTRSRAGIAWAGVSGTAAGFALLLRLGNVVLLPPLGLWLVWQLWRTARTDRRWQMAAVAGWLGPIVACGVLLGVYNAARFGSPLETGYANQAEAFTTPLYVGVYGLLLSSGKSIFVYAPVLLVGVLGWMWMLRERRSVALLLMGLVGAYILFYARWDWWYGGGPWGPRFMVVMLPFLALGIAAVVDRGRSFTGSLAILGLGAVSFGVQVLSILVPYLPYEAQMEQDTLSFERLLWNPAYSPVVAHATSLAQGQYPPDLAFTYYLSPFVTWLQVGALAVAACLIVGGVWAEARQHPAGTGPGGYLRAAQPPA